MGLSDSYALEALRRGSHLVAAHADVDALGLYQDGRGNEQAYWRHVWLYLVRTALDIPEADIARALTVAMVRLELKHASDAPIHHDTIANACKRVEDERAERQGLSDWLDTRSEELASAMREGRAFREAIEAAFARPIKRNVAAEIVARKQERVGH